MTRTNSQGYHRHPVGFVAKRLPDVQDVCNAPEGAHGKNQAILDPQKMQWGFVDGIDSAQGKMELEPYVTLR